MNNIPLPEPTAATRLSRAIAAAGSVLYCILLGACILYLIYCIIVELRDWVRRKLITKYLKQDEPVEWILDYPGYAIGEYYPSKDDNHT